MEGREMATFGERAVRGIFDEGMYFGMNRLLRAA
jgi:hypothetical protein